MRGAQRRGTAIRAHVYVDGHRYWRTFPATTPPEEIALWRAPTRKTAKWAARAGQPIAGTLAEDVVVYLETFLGRHPETLKQRARHLRLWATAFAGRRRADLNAAAIERQLRLWQSQHAYAPATLNKLRQALYQLYAFLDRGTGINPESAVPTFDVPDPTPRAVPYARLRQLFAVMPAGPTKWRLLLMAYAGLRPEEIRRVGWATGTGRRCWCAQRRAGRRRACRS